MPIYLDHNATSPSTPEHLQKLFIKLQTCSANSSSPHAMGRNAAVAINISRQLIAKALNVDAGQLIFVSGATEANNLATTGVLNYLGLGSTHAIASGIEHPSVLEPLQALQKNSALNLSIIAPDEDGIVDVAKIITSINPQTAYITLIGAQNEVGSLQNIKLLGDFLHYKRWGVAPNTDIAEILQLEAKLSPDIPKESLQKLHFHVDAVQLFGKVPAHVWMSLGIDSCAVSGHKLGALQGIGALFIRRGRRFMPMLLGGAQEKNRRAGTENLAGIISFGLVCENLLEQKYWDDIIQLNALRVKLYNAICNFPNVSMNSLLTNCLANTINFSVVADKKNGEDILLNLDLKHIYASSGSACSSSANLASKILLAMGRNEKQAKNAIRISLSPANTMAEVEIIINILQQLLV